MNNTKNKKNETESTFISWLEIYARELLECYPNGTEEVDLEQACADFTLEVNYTRNLEYSFGDPSPIDAGELHETVRKLQQEKKQLEELCEEIHRDRRLEEIRNNK